jgi:putative flippase GtrA
MKNERKAKISMSFWFSLVVLIENALAIGVSTVAVTVLNQAFGEWVNIEPAVLVFLFSIAIGTILAFLMNRFFLIPLKKIIGGGGG